MLYRNAKIFTSDPSMYEADCMVVSDGYITWIGRESELPACYKHDLTASHVDSSVIDLQGKRVIPGIVDAHMHPIILADGIDKITCLPPLVHSIEELKDVIRKAAAEKADGEWICGWGYDEGKFAELRKPDKYDLDDASCGHPVELLRSCSHIRSVNSKALEIAGITKDTPEVPGGEIVRDTDGEPNGILLENARHLVADFLPAHSDEQLIDLLVQLGDILLSYGITAITDMGNFISRDFYNIYKKAADRGFRQELGVYYMWDLMREFPGFDMTPEDLDPTQQIHKMGLKLIADGSVAGQTAWMGRPYLNANGLPGDTCGMPVCSDEELTSAIAFCKDHRCQLSVHAMGMQAIDRVLSFMEPEENWMPDGIPAFRIEHVTDPSDYAIDTAVKKGIPFATQPIFFYSEIESYLKNLGIEWTRECYPIRKLLDRGVTVALSTDSPATSWATMYDPYVNMLAAVTRQAYEGTDCGTEQAIDIQTALELYTRESARIAGFADMGMLRVGYKANFVVLNEDILTIESSKIDRIRPEATYIRGDSVYTRRRC